MFGFDRSNADLGRARARARHGYERCRSGPEDPSSVVVQPKVDQPPEVDRRHPQRQAELVPDHAPVADPAMAVGHDQMFWRALR